MEPEGEMDRELLKTARHLGCLAHRLRDRRPRSPVPTPWLVMAVVISISNSAVELYSPRATDDFAMATTNALLCRAFGALVY
jgi:hypothetical protein